jgi:Fic family protein
MRRLIPPILRKNAENNLTFAENRIPLGEEKKGMSFYIHELKNWPAFTWENNALLPALSRVRHKQGRLKGIMEALGFDMGNENVLQTMTSDVLSSSQIEGEILDTDQVRSSIARKLGLDIAGLVPSARHVDGVVEMMVDATQFYKKPLSKNRLFGWQSSLFPGGKNGLFKINTGKWRDDKRGPMQVVSGRIGKERVHFRATAAKKLEKEMKLFLNWFNTNHELEPVLKSGIAHLWFVTIHPFSDGNGRIARAIADLQLARADDSPKRFYSMSAQIQKDRYMYYTMLEKTQKGNLDITAWLKWYLDCLENSLDATDHVLQRTQEKTLFWEAHALTELNDRQRKMINKLIDGFTGKLTSSKWAKITKSSPDTALRDINDLIDKNILVREPGGGRSTSYVMPG